MDKNIFTTTIEELQESEEKYNLEDCGMSGLFIGWHWFCDNEKDVNVYFRLED